MTNRAGEAVPTFYLYGEAHQHVDEGFVHVESIDDRSRPSEWTIRAHAHAELHHLFHIRSGGGTMRAEAERLAFEAPCLLIVPAGMIHGLDWRSESAGAVVTLSDACIARLAHADRTLAPLFADAAVVVLDAEEHAAVAAITARLMLELGWRAPGHRAAAEGQLLDLLVRALRRLALSPEQHARTPGAQAALVARYRERVEQRFRLREPIARHAAALGTSESRLRAACAAVARRSPLQIFDQRVLLEAQRALLYSNLTIAEIARKLGFEDAAYFSRFFRRHVGHPPQAFRRGGDAP